MSATDVGSAGRDRADTARSPLSLPTEDGIHLVQLLIPLFDNSGQEFPRAHYDDLNGELTREFGGVTAYTRAPARGTWAGSDDAPRRDDIVIYEVMVEPLDRIWWAAYRGILEERFDQDEVLIRAQLVERL